MTTLIHPVVRPRAFSSLTMTAISVFAWCWLRRRNEPTIIRLIAVDRSRADSISVAASALRVASLGARNSIFIPTVQCPR